MGYDLHITRKKLWFDEEDPSIPFDHWQKVVQSDPELTPYLEASNDDQTRVASYIDQIGCLTWSEGEICAKNPNLPLVIKMVSIAAELQAHVQGDDGELYQQDGSALKPMPVPARSATMLSGFVRWFSAKWFKRGVQQNSTHFKVGDRIRDAFGSPGAVIDVDPNAMGGLGRIVIRLDDGREQILAYVASGLERDTTENFRVT